MSSTRRRYYQNPQDSEAGAGINAQAFTVVLDGTSGNGAVGNVNVATIAESGTRIYELSVIAVGLTPDTATPTLKWKLSTDGDLTTTDTAEDLNDNGTTTYQTSAIATTAANRTLQLEVAGAAVSGTIKVIIKYLLP